MLIFYIPSEERRQTLEIKRQNVRYVFLLMQSLQKRYELLLFLE